MSKRTVSRKIGLAALVIIVVLVVGGCAVYAYTHLKHSSVAMTSNLVIENSGSTNAAGWDLTVKPNGSGTLEYTSGRDGKTYQSGTFAVKDFTDALKDVGTLSDLKPTGQLMKSASFGTNEYAQYQGHKTGDLNESYDKNSQAQKKLHTVLQSMVEKAAPALEPRFGSGEPIK